MRRSIEALRLFFIRRRYYTVHVRVRCRRVMRTGKQSNAPSHAGRRAPCPGPASTSPSTTRPLGAVGRSRSSRACGQVLGSHRFKGKLVGGGGGRSSLDLITLPLVGARSARSLQLQMVSDLA
jgi:hypothetical protein